MTGSAPQSTNPPQTTSGGTKAVKAGVLACGCLAAVAVLGLVVVLMLDPWGFWKPQEPPAVAELPLLIDAAPWGEVTQILDGTGETHPLPKEPITPVTVMLPPGRYTVELRHPLTGEVGRCEVRLVEGEGTTCHVPLLNDQGQEYFAEIGWGKGGKP